MANEREAAQESATQAVWYCERCVRHIGAADVVQRAWGRSTAIVCPTCHQRLGELLWDKEPPAPADARS